MNLDLVSFVRNSLPGLGPTPETVNFRVDHWQALPLGQMDILILLSTSTLLTNETDRSGGIFFFFTHSVSCLDDVHGSEALGVKRF